MLAISPALRITSTNLPGILDVGLLSCIRDVILTNGCAFHALHDIASLHGSGLMHNPVVFIGGAHIPPMFFKPFDAFQRHGFFMEMIRGLFPVVRDLLNEFCNELVGRYKLARNFRGAHIPYLFGVELVVGYALILLVAIWFVEVKC